MIAMPRKRDKVLTLLRRLSLKSDSTVGAKISQAELNLTSSLSGEEETVQKCGLELFESLPPEIWDQILYWVRPKRSSSRLKLMYLRSNHGGDYGAYQECLGCGVVLLSSRPDCMSASPWISRWRNGSSKVRQLRDSISWSMRRTSF